MNDLDDQILETIRDTPGLRAKDIAAELGIERPVVNSVLYRLKGKVQQDRAYRWYARGAAELGLRDEGPVQLDTALAQLCRYYLDCLSHDDLNGVSEFAASKYGDPNYVELRTMPMFDEDAEDPFESEAGRRLLGRIRRDRNRKTILLGYPVRLNLIRSRKGWEGFMVEPLLLFSFEDAAARYSVPTLTDDLPQINLRALRALTNAGDSNLMEEAIQLTEELGLGTLAAEQPDLDELLLRLRDIRPEWDWQEKTDPFELSQGTPLSDVNQPGIFNRAVLIAAERSPYTKGLESELGMLQAVEEAKYSGTALGAWLGGRTIESPPADQQPLLEVLPLNSEQRQAVRQAFANPLTVITGPPGTGKSQVVTSILVNASWQGKTVLFASKNNKAVDVVEARVNGLGARPVLLRLGANEYQGRLAAFLVSLLAASVTPDDQEAYRDRESVHAELQGRSEALDAELEATVALRNDVDRLEQQAEQIREDAGTETFHRFRSINYQQLDHAAQQLRAAIDAANKNRQPLVSRVLWRLLCNSRFARLRADGIVFQQDSRGIGLLMPDRVPDAISIDEWVQYGVRLTNRLGQIPAVQEYFLKLAALTAAPSLEELSKQRRALTEDLADNSEALWRAWLRLQPSRMSREQRKLLGDYGALLQLIVSANEQNQQLGADVFRRVHQLFPKITSILGCWAVTSLSARGRVPFDPSFFDLLVIDEASQCDIASALPLLYRARQVVVIGDPMQLRHISTLPKRQDQELLSKHGLVDDYAAWTYSTRSLFDLASSLCRSEDIVSLRDHHRSHADIIEFSNQTFYEGRLRIATTYDLLRRPARGEPAVRWIDIRGKTVRPGTGGAVNEVEAAAVADEISRLVSQGYRGSIGVVSPFRAQANRIRDLVFAHDGLTSRIGDVDFLADTVHRFQGDERDVMIFSPGVAAGVSDTALGWLRSNPNLFNVAITRARAALIVVGDKSAALRCNVDYLAQFAAYTETVGRRDDQSSIVAPADLGADYPPVSNPERVSDWERLFYRALYREGIRPIPQYQVEKYDLDLALVDGQRRLDIEVDGERYHRNWDGELCRRDQIRNQRLMELGWDVMRFWVYQVRDDLEESVNRVRSWLEQGGKNDQP